MPPCLWAPMESLEDRRRRSPRTLQLHPPLSCIILTLKFSPGSEPASILYTVVKVRNSRPSKLLNFSAMTV